MSLIKFKKVDAACDDKMAEYEAAYRKDSPEVRARKIRTAKALGDTRSLEMYARVDKELGRVTHDAADAAAQDAGTKGVVFPLNGKYYFAKADEYGQAEFSKMTGPYDSVDFAKRDAKSAYGVTITEVMTRTPRGGEYHKVKDAAQDAGVPNDLAFAVGAIENAIEKYNKTFSRYEDNLEEKDFKRYNAIFHAAVNMHRAIQSA